MILDRTATYRYTDFTLEVRGKSVASALVKPFIYTTEFEINSCFLPLSLSIKLLHLLTETAAAARDLLIACNRYPQPLAKECLR